MNRDVGLHDYGRKKSTRKGKLGSAGRKKLTEATP